MKRIAIGVRMHSGWGVLVAVSLSAGIVEVVGRRRIALTAPGALGMNHPYHFAENLGLPEAEKFLGNCVVVSEQLATAAVRELVDNLRCRHYCVADSAVLVASDHPLPDLSKILASHPLIHAAEAEFFHSAIRKACEDLGLAVTGIRERNLDESVRTAFGEESPQMLQQIVTLGRSLGPPWTKDQKTAALAGLVVLAKQKVFPANHRSRKSLPLRRS